jgi:hypothetical protein
MLRNTWETAMKRIAALSVLLLLIPQFAFAAQNSPEVIIISSVAMLVLAAFVVIYQVSASKGAASSDNANLADQNSILFKLNYRINGASIYKIEVYRQSGNIERVEYPILGSDVAEKILTSMRRASITAVSITERAGGIDIRRLIHNGRGRQEGKRIGGYFITEVSSSVRSLGGMSKERTPTQNDVDNEPISISATSEAEAALIKCWYRIADQIPTDEMGNVRNFVSGFDEKTGMGTGSISHVDFFVFLALIDKFLIGEADITTAVRSELENSDSPHHRVIANEVGRSRIRGIESFGASPKDIKVAFERWFHLLSFAEVIRENRPKTLSINLDDVK